MNNYHLTQRIDGWKLSEEGSSESIQVFHTKEEGLRLGRKIIERRGDGTGSLKIHGSDGAIQEERTYPRAADPIAIPA